MVINDVILGGEIKKEKEEWRTEAAFASCIGGAMKLKEYIDLFQDVGFKQPYAEDHSIEMKKAAYKILLAYGSVENFSASFKSGGDAESWRRIFKEGKPRYALIAVNK